MGVDSPTLRWPAAWKDPGTLGLLQATPIRNLLFDVAGNLPGVVDEVRRGGFTIIDPANLPSGIQIIKGPWPGIRMSRSGGDRAAAGPTGEPWVDSNGWRVRVARAQHPGDEIWIDSRPQASRTSLQNYVVAFADAAAHSARWILSLDDALAQAIAARNADALATWRRLLEAAAFFHQRVASTDRDEAVVGVLSSFSGPKAAFSDEVVNNLARTKQQYRCISANRVATAALSGLKGIIYTDAAEPDPDTRRAVLDFVQAGGMLITSAAWGSLPKGEAEQRTHPRYALRGVGRGAIALSTASFSDPYRLPNDAIVLVSHRHDIVRFFNSGAISPCLKAAAGNRSALHTVFYSLRPVEDTSAWIGGTYRSATLRTWNQPQPQTLKLQPRDAGVEVYLPAIAQYAVIELES